MDVEVDGRYSLEPGVAEYERLRVQSRLWEPATRRAFDAVGVRPGMRCLDVGCGPGEGMRLLAEFVGPGGTVTGIDADGAAGREALEYLRSTSACPANFVEGDVREIDEPPGAPYDVVTVRLLLMHLPDPVTVLRKLI